MAALDSFSEAVRYVWACHEAFKRIGFDTDHIWVMTARNAGLRGGPVCAWAGIRVPDYPEFWIGCSVITNGQVFYEEWREFCTAFNARAFDAPDLLKVFFACPYIQPAWALPTAILRKGIPLPTMGGVPLDEAQKIATELLREAPPS